MKFLPANSVGVVAPQPDDLIRHLRILDLPLGEPDFRGCVLGFGRGHAGLPRKQQYLREINQGDNERNRIERCLSVDDVQ